MLNMCEMAKGRSLKVLLFKSLCAVSSSPFIVMTISFIVCDIQRLIGKKSRHFYTVPIFIALAACDRLGVS